MKMGLSMKLVICWLLGLAATHAFVFPSAPPLRRPEAQRSAIRQTSKAPSSRPSRCVMSMSEIPGGGEAILLADEIFGQVAAGGIGIILSGVVGAFIVGNIANLDELEDTFSEERRPSEDTLRDEDEYDVGGIEETVINSDDKGAGSK